jgi:hypothetical protein
VTVPEFNALFAHSTAWAQPTAKSKVGTQQIIALRDIVNSSHHSTDTGILRCIPGFCEPPMRAGANPKRGRDREKFLGEIPDFRLHGKLPDFVLVLRAAAA